MDHLWETVAAIIGSVGGSGLIILGLAKWVGGYLANALLEEDKARYTEELAGVKAKYDRELEEDKRRYGRELQEAKADLDRISGAMSRYAESQFPLYNELWKSLSDLKDSGEELWRVASRKNIHPFAKQLRETLQTVNRSALLIEEDDYLRLSNLLKTFAEFQVGKERLIEMRLDKARQVEADGRPDDEIAQVIGQNGRIKREFDSVVNGLRQPFREQISGRRGQQ